MNRKSQGVAALLNFLFWGVGYIYAGRKVRFGIGLFLFDYILIAIFWGSNIFLYPQVWIPEIVISILFAWDGYKTAEEVNLEHLADGKSAGKILYCQNCGSKIPYNALFCEQCGSRLEK